MLAHAKHSPDTQIKSNTCTNTRTRIQYTKIVGNSIYEIHSAKAGEPRLTANGLVRSAAAHRLLDAENHAVIEI